MPDQISASRYSGRRRNDVVAKVLAFAATAVGLGWLVLILGALLWKGFSGLSVAVFTEMTPPPGSAGGLLNAIFGSAVMTVMGIAVGAPLGVLAGTYLAEYGGNSRRSITSAPTAAAMAAVSSEQLSAMTTSRSVGSSWGSKLSSDRRIPVASSCAGIRTATFARVPCGWAALRR